MEAMPTKEELFHSSSDHTHIHSDEASSVGKGWERKKWKNEVSDSGGEKPKGLGGGHEQFNRWMLR
jgi:hypothetical protein